MVLGLPLVGSHLAQAMVQVTDTLMLGWYGVAELAAGGAVGGIGFQWDKCSVCASDWDAFAPSAAGVAAGLSPAGIMVSGYNIWTGASSPDLIPRIHDFTLEKLHGKKGFISDHHSQAAVDTIAKLEGVRTLALIKRASWDEAAMLV